ncbi:MAG: tetratricopeptide repeat protein [Nitrospinota bacterium]
MDSSEYHGEGTHFVKKFAELNVKRACFFLLFCSSLIYLNSSFNSFHFDDLATIVHNPFIRKAENIPSFFTNPKAFSVTGDSMYRPLLLVSYAVNYIVGGDDVFGYHLFNIFLHSLNTVLLFFLIYQVNLNSGEKSRFAPEMKRSSLYGAFWGALLFGVHTIHTQAVNYISSRSVLLVAFFFLAAFNLYIRSSSRPVLYATSFLLYLLALLSKEIAVTFPVLIVVYCLLFEFPEKRSSLLRSVPFIAVNILGVFYAVGVYGMSEVELTKETFFEGQNFPRSPWSNLLTQSTVLMYYLRLFLFPAGLALLHDFTVQNSIKESLVVCSLLLHGALLATGIYLSRIHRGITLGILWFFIVFIPEVVIPLNMVVNEHRTYLPLSGFFLVIALLFTYAVKKFPGKKAFCILNAGMLLVVFLLGMTTVLRNQVWKNDITLWQDNISKNPQSYVAYDNLSAEYIVRGETKKAIRSIQRSLDLSPARSFPYLNLGIIHLKEKAYGLAIKNLTLSLQFKPDSPEALNMLGLAMLGNGEPAGAVDTLTEAKRMRPFSDEIRYNLARANYALGEFQESVLGFEKSIELNPDYVEAYNNLGLAYMGLGKYPMALKALEVAHKKQPDSLSVLNNIAILSLETGDLPRALSALERILSIDSSFADGLNTFGEYFLKTGEYQKALEFFEKTISLTGGALPYWNAAVAAEKLGRVELAIGYWQNFLKRSAGARENEKVKAHIRTLRKGM